DGTLNEVGTGLVHSDVTLGMIPMGSGNGLTRSLKIPQNVEQACELITQGCISAIDVGKANERYFFLVAGMGFDAIVGKRFDDYPGRGPLPYFYFSFKEYFAYKPQTVKISFNDRAFEISPFVIAVANGQQYGNNAMIAPAAKLNDGLLDICIVHRLTLFQAFTALPKLFNGQLQKYRDAEFHQSQAVWIERSAPDYINIDGEPVLEKAKVHISILPESLNVITPQNCPSLIK
ncbi:MAG: diacylglycerol/lipid kinase family protein, partial [bacterium]